MPLWCDMRKWLNPFCVRVCAPDSISSGIFLYTVLRIYIYIYITWTRLSGPIYFVVLPTKYIRKNSSKSSPRRRNWTSWYRHRGSRHNQLDASNWFLAVPSFFPCYRVHLLTGVSTAIMSRLSIDEIYFSMYFYPIIFSSFLLRSL